MSKPTVANVRPIEWGEEVLMPDSDDPAREVAWVAVKACDENAGHWYCTTHREGFANNIGKDAHIRRGVHALAWVCHVHGIEVP